MTGRMSACCRDSGRRRWPKGRARHRAPDALTGWLPWVRTVAAPAALAITPAVYLQPAWTIMLAVDMVLLLTLVIEELTRRFGPSTRSAD